MNNLKLLLGQRPIPAVIALVAFLAMIFGFIELGKSRQPIRTSGNETRTQEVASAAFSDGINYFHWLGHLDQAQQKFEEAAALGLPRGRYGVACVIYHKGDDRRVSEAIRNLSEAASHNVLEAMPVLAAYYWHGAGIAVDRRRAASLMEAAAALTLISNKIGGAGYETLDPSLCGPSIRINFNVRDFPYDAFSDLTDEKERFRHSLDLISSE